MAPPKLCELSSQTREPPAIVLQAPPQGGSAAAAPQGSGSIIAAPKIPDTVAQKHGGPNISVEAQVYGQVFLGFWQVFLRVLVPS